MAKGELKEYLVERTGLIKNELRQSMRRKGFIIFLILSVLALLSPIVLAWFTPKSVYMHGLPVSYFYESCFSCSIHVLLLINVFRALNSFAHEKESGAADLIKLTGQGGEWSVWQRWASYMIQNMIFLIPAVGVYMLGTRVWGCDVNGAYIVDISGYYIFIGGYLLALSLWMSTYPVIYRVVFAILATEMISIASQWLIMPLGLESYSGTRQIWNFFSLTTMSSYVGFVETTRPVVANFEQIVTCSVFIVFLIWEAGMRLGSNEVNSVKKQRVILLIYAFIGTLIFLYHLTAGKESMGTYDFVNRFGVIFAIALVSELTRKERLSTEEIYDLAVSKKSSYGRLGSLLFLPGWQNLVILSLVCYLILVVPGSLAIVSENRWGAEKFSTVGVVMWANMLFPALILRKAIVKVGDWGLMLYFGCSFAFLLLSLYLAGLNYFALSDFLPWGNIEGLSRDKGMNVVTEPYALWFVGAVIGTYLLSSAQYWRGFLSRLNPKPDENR